MNKVNVAVSLALEIWDFAGDGYLFHVVLTASPEFKRDLGSPALVSWIVFFCLSVVASLTGMMFKFKVVLALRRERRMQFALTRDERHAIVGISASPDGMFIARVWACRYSK